jgi:creatinine amidohydrolase
MLVTYENTSPEVGKANPTVAVLPLGATECCGDHLPVGTANVILGTVARGVAARLSDSVYLLPVLPFGTSGHMLGEPGVVALEWRTLMDAIRDLVDSLLAQSIGKVVLMCGLGGPTAGTTRPDQNYIAKTTVRQLNYDHPELDVIWLQPFTLAKPALGEILSEAEDDVHAGELATSVMLYLDPEHVDMPARDFVPPVGKEYRDYVAFKAICPGGVWGSPSLATADKGRLALEAAISASVKYIEATFSRLAELKGRTRP